MRQTMLMLMVVMSLVAMAAADETEPAKAEWESIEVLDAEDDGVVDHAKKLKGRDFVRLGKLGTRTGILVQAGHEWGLKVGDTIYDLHLGPEQHRADHPELLQNGASAEVKGFLYKTDLAVCTLMTAGTTLRLRSDTGRPAWAGRRLGGGR